MSHLKDKYTVVFPLLKTGDGSDGNPFEISLAAGALKVTQEVYDAMTGAEQASGVYEILPPPAPTINLFQEGDGTESNPTANIADAIANAKPMAVTDGAGTVTQLFDPMTLPALEAWAIAQYGAGTTVDPVTYIITPNDGSTANIPGWFDPTTECKVLVATSAETLPTPVEVVAGSQYTWTYASGLVVTADITQNQPMSTTPSGGFVLLLPTNGGADASGTVVYTFDVSSLNGLNGCNPKMDLMQSSITDIDGAGSFGTVVVGADTNLTSGTFNEAPAGTYNAVGPDSDVILRGRYLNVIANQTHTYDFNLIDGDQAGLLTFSRIKKAAQARYLNGGAHFVGAEDSDGTPKTEVEIENP